MFKQLIMIAVLTFPLYAQKVSLQLQYLDQFQFAGYYMAQEKGFYKEAGLEVELKKYNPDIVPLDEVIEGRATFGTGRSSMMIAASEGKPIRPLAAIFQSSPQILLATPSSKIKTIKEMKDKYIMITHDSLDAVAVMAMLNSQGISKNDFVPIKHDYVLQNLIDNKVDVMSAYLSNEPYALREQGIEPVIFHPKDYGFDFYEDILFTSQKEIDEHPAQVDKFLQASLLGWEYAFAHIEESVDVILEKYNTQEKSKEALLYEAKMLKSMAYVEGVKLGDISKDKLQRIYDIYRVMGMLNKTLDFDSFLYTMKSIPLVLSTKEKRYLKKKQLIKMCVDPDWMPYESIEKGKHIGIAADIMKDLSKRLHVPFELVKTKTWDESLQKAEHRECDIVSLAMATDSREKFLEFTSPYIQMPFVIVTQADKPFIDGGAELRGQRVAVIKNYAISHILKEDYDDIDVVEVSSIKEAMKMVYEGKVYGYVDAIIVIREAIERYGYHNALKISGKLKESLELSVGIRNDDKMLFNILNKGIMSFDEKTIENYIAQWANVIHRKIVDYSLVWKLLALFFIIFSIMIWAYNKLSKTKDELEESLNNFETLFDSTRDIVVVINQDLKVLLVNKAGLNTFGYTKEEALTLSARDFIEPGNEDIVKMIQTYNSNVTFEVELYKKDGTLVPCRASGKNILYQGKPARVSILTNLTDVKKAQQKLIDLNQSLEEKVAVEVENSRQKDKQMLAQSRLAQMGEMISMIAHQWRQPLGAIAATGIDMKMAIMMGRFDLDIKEQREEQETFMIEELEHIESYVQTLTETIDDFRNFYKPNKEREILSINVPFEKSFDILKGSMDSQGIMIERSLQSTTELALFNNELMQVFLNILKNALDNFKEKGLKKPMLLIESKDTDAGVCLSIYDNGGGIPEDIMIKIFDPYFSTKDEKNGTGLGLYMSKIIVEEHHKGKLRVENKNDGVCFNVEICDLKS
jgi:PAS domain S-box-containing protein